MALVVLTVKLPAPIVSLGNCTPINAAAVILICSKSMLPVLLSSRGAFVGLFCSLILRLVKFRLEPSFTPFATMEKAADGL